MLTTTSGSDSIRRTKAETASQKSEHEHDTRRTERRTKHDSVDDGGESRDTGSLDSNDPRRSGGSFSVEEIRVVGVDDETNDEGTENVEDDCATHRNEGERCSIRNETA